MTKDETADHLVKIANKTLEDAGRSMLKLWDDARYAGCLREFRVALMRDGTYEDAEHFLGKARLEKIS